MKKAISVVLSLVMVILLTCPAFAAEDGCVIGVDTSAAAAANPRKASFAEAAAVVTAEEALTEPFMRMIFCHHHHIPYEVAQTERLLIRESMPEDYEAISRMLARCSDQVFSGNLTAEEIGNQERFDAYVRTAYAFFGYGMWTVQRRADRAVIGWCGLFPVTDCDREERQDASWGIELGYLIGEAYRRQGYAYEACSRICDYAFEELGAAAIGLETVPENQASVQLARKLGFRPSEKNRWILYTFSGSG